MLHVSGLWGRISWVNSCKGVWTVLCRGARQLSWRWWRGAAWPKEKEEKAATWFRPGLGTQRCGLPRGWHQTGPEDEWWRVEVRSLPGRGNRMCEAPQTRGSRSLGGPRSGWQVRLGDQPEAGTKGFLTPASHSGERAVLTCSATWKALGEPRLRATSAPGAGVCSRGSFVRSCQGQRDQGVGWLCAVRLGQRKSQSRWSRNKAERAEGRQADTGRQQREREISEKKRSPGSRHVTKEGRRASSLREWSRSQGPWGHQAAWQPRAWRDARHPQARRRPGRVSSGRSLPRLAPVLRHCPPLPWWDEGSFVGTFHRHHPRMSRRKVLGEAAFKASALKPDGLQSPLHPHLMCEWV